MSNRISTRWIVPALIFVMVMGVGQRSAWGYFTDSKQAIGGLRLFSSPDTQITETFGGKVKDVVITNRDVEDAVPVFVRAKVLKGSILQASVNLDKSEGWSAADDGWYVYGVPLGVGESANVLKVDVDLDALNAWMAENNLKPDDGDNYSVVVVYEATPVLYNEDGSAYADWSNAAKTNEEVGGDQS